MDGSHHVQADMLRAQIALAHAEWVGSGEYNNALLEWASDPCNSMGDMVDFELSAQFRNARLAYRQRINRPWEIDESPVVVRETPSALP